jgi:ATP-dependent exoDNAse (exonuclease V) beta subunit
VPSASAAPLPKIHLANQVAAQEEATQSLFFSGWEQQSRRHVGTLVHQLLEQLARRGTSWFEEARAGLDLSLKRQLASLGVPAYELDACLDHIRAAVAQTRASRLGGWILQNHADSACELELSGQLDGQLVHAVIDRSFIDDSGIRWVIDYKTSSPKAAESVDSFVRRESEHYRAQLAGYARLMAALEPERLIRTALYFPLIDHFEEVNHA